MASASPSLKFAFALAISFSLTVSPSSSRSLRRLSSPLALRPSSSPSRPSPAQKLAADLLSLLGSPEDAARLDPKEVDALRSCLRLLAPLPGSSSGSEKQRRRSLLLAGDDELVRWPPPPVMELARLSVDSGGDPAEIHRALDPTVLPVPDVEGAKEDKCELTRTPYGRRFINKELNEYFAFLFEMIAARAPLVGFNVTLNRYDLFHGHLFLATNTGRLGILFHAKEYPAYEKRVFPYHMGYCQTGSNVVYDDSMNLRNILWLAPLPSNPTKAWVAPGVLVVLDAYPGGIIYSKLVPDYVDYVRTIYEDDFGDVVCDVNYLNVGNVVPGDRIFMC